MKVRYEFTIGIVGLVTLIILFFGIKFLKGTEIFSTNRTYYSFYDNVSGMHESNYIYINGMKVGYVKKIKPSDKTNSRFLVEISVDKSVEIPSDSKLVLFSDGLLGGKALKIESGTSTKILSKGDTIASFVETGLTDGLSEEITPMMGNLSVILKRIDTLTASLNNALNTQSQLNIQMSLQNINSITERLDKIAAQADELVGKDKSKLDNIVSNVESITDNLVSNNQTINNIITRFDNITDTLEKNNIGQTLASVNTSLSNLNIMLNRIEKGNGNIGQLLNDDQLYDNINLSAKNLNLLIEDIKKNPKKYLKVSVF